MCFSQNLRGYVLIYKKSLGGYLIMREGPEVNYLRFIGYHKARLLSAESYYWLGIAYNDFYKDTRKVLDCFMKNVMMTNNYDKFHEIYYGKVVEQSVHEGDTAAKQ